MVLSVCAIPDGHFADSWRLVHGSLLVVPRDCAAVSWAEWHREQSHSRGRHKGPLPAAFAIHGADWLLGRAVLEMADASEWLQAVTTAVDAAAEGPVELSLPATGDIPGLAAILSAPQALVRVFPHVDSATNSLIAGLARPVQGLLWSSPGP